jgi:hypothetical protein
VTERDDALAALWRAVDSYNLSNDRIDMAVRRARGCGATWDQIALALGVSRQAAWMRYARHLREATQVAS